jgi:FkbM family methyltransferase
MNVLNLLPNNPIIIEAGTASGYDTEHFCKRFPEGKIFGFEPVPELFYQTQERIKNYNNCNVENKALAEKSGKVKMVVSNIDGETSESSSILNPKEHLKYYRHIKFDKTIEVQAINLDEFVLSKNLKTIDLLWLDLQGYEPFIFISSPITLSITKHIITEVNYFEHYEGCIQWEQLKNILIKNQFECIHHDKDHNDKLVVGNAIFKKINL